MDFLSNIFQWEHYTPYQRNIAKSLIFCFAPSYSALYLYEKGFKHSDMVTRLFFSTTLDILLITFSMCFLYAAQRATKTKFGHELFMLTSPPIAFLTFILTSPNMYGIGLFACIFTCIKTYCFFYIPFVLFGCAMMFAVKFDNLKNKIHPQKRNEEEEVNATKL